MEKAIVYSYATGKILKDPVIIKKRKIRWKRLFIALTVVSIFLYGAISLVIQAFTFGYQAINDYSERTYQKALAQYEQVHVVIGYGETAWNLQKTLTPNEDVRKLLYLTSTLNPDVNLGSLHAGDVITMLKEKTE